MSLTGRTESELEADLRAAAVAIAGPAEDVIPFFKSLSAMARRDASHHLYCWLSW